VIFFGCKFVHRMCSSCCSSCMWIKVAFVEHRCIKLTTFIRSRCRRRRLRSTSDIITYNIILFMRQDTRYKNNMNKTMTSLCLIGNWRASHLSSALGVAWNEKLKDKSDINRPTSPYWGNITSQNAQVMYSERMFYAHPTLLASEVLLLLAHVGGTVSYRLCERRTSVIGSLNTCSWKRFYLIRPWR